MPKELVGIIGEYAVEFVVDVKQEEARRMRMEAAFALPNIYKRIASLQPTTWFGRFFSRSSNQTIYRDQLNLIQKLQTKPVAISYSQYISDLLSEYQLNEQNCDSGLVDIFKKLRDQEKLIATATATQAVTVASTITTATSTVTFNQSDSKSKSKKFGHGSGPAD